MSLVAYLNVNEDGMVVFNWFVNLCATGLLLAYICMWWSYFQFRRAWEAQHKTKMRNPEYPYFTGPKWLHPVLTYLGMTFTILVVFFNGFWIFFLEILMYLICLQVTLPQLSLFAYFYFGRSIKTKFRTPLTADLISGKQKVDDEEEVEEREYAAKQAEYVTAVWYVKAWRWFYNLCFS